MTDVSSGLRAGADTGRPFAKNLQVNSESVEQFLLRLEDDTEDAPWMVMGSLQWDATTELYVSLREYAERHQPTWYVGGMCAILFTRRETGKRGQLAPDLFVTFVSRHPRESFDADAEGFPPFVLEVVSPSSAYRDQYEKRVAYEALGVREYVLFYPGELGLSRLDGFRRGGSGQFEPWPRDEQGRLRSELLGLYLLADGTSVRAATGDGVLLPTLHEEAEARAQEAAARQEVEAENEHLRRQIEELQHQLQTEG